jgi:solute carrier family 25 phosphate transporter 3
MMLNGSDVGKLVGDIILTETYKKDEAYDRAFVEVVYAIHAREFIGEFFRGTGARIVHVGMIITSQMVIYDIVKQMLGLATTGSHKQTTRRKEA